MKTQRSCSEYDRARPTIATVRDQVDQVRTSELKWLNAIECDTRTADWVCGIMGQVVEFENQGGPEEAKRNSSTRNCRGNVARIAVHYFGTSLSRKCACPK